MLFNAVGVEGYNARDARCRLLKCALNRRTVKMLTTRDDAETLRRFYCPRSRLDIHQVADPAIWTPEAFGVSHAPNTTDPTIGLNVIRPEIFGEYLYLSRGQGRADSSLLPTRASPAGRRAGRPTNLSGTRRWRRCVAPCVR